MSHRLPNGKHVEDLDTCLREWNKITKPLIKHLGVTVVGFDPGILFVDGRGDDQNRRSVDIPIWFAKRIAEALNQIPEPEPKAKRKRK